MEQADTAEQRVSSGTGDEAALVALLRWYVAMGVDVPIADTPRDGFALSAAPSAQASPRRAAIAPPAAPAGAAKGSGKAPLSAEALVRQAEALAGAAASLEELAAAWATLPGCDLAAKSTGMIFADGRPGSALMLIGGAPDSDDERSGRAYTDAKGRLLNAMLRAIGRTRDTCYLAHVVPWRPPGNRPPTPLELALCLPFVRRQIALAAPRLILCLGDRAAQPILNSREPVTRLRGRLLSFEGDGATLPALVTFPPDYLLKQPLAKRRAWADLQMAADALREAGA